MWMLDPKLLVSGKKPTAPKRQNYKGKRTCLEIPLMHVERMFQVNLNREIFENSTNIKYYSDGSNILASSSVTTPVSVTRSYGFIVPHQPAKIFENQAENLIRISRSALLPWFLTFRRTFSLLGICEQVNSNTVA